MRGERGGIGPGCGESLDADGLPLLAVHTQGPHDLRIPHQQRLFRFDPGLPVHPLRGP